MLAENSLTAEADIADLHNPASGAPAELTEIRTYYESQWIDRGLSIKYLRWRLPADGAPLREPDIEIEPDTYRSFSRGHIQMPQIFE